ncbi:type II secretion system F family protein [Sinomonas sp. ASV322]|uniref:type II secretion system F family protein n=1 Tax=Sinomonas sp. ASV322 TaxID=3041920 RepID=UPI0027DD69DC|nr:type II secretion system F family protein [Sinomonas sp. ASV322]MDQ4501864.1 type II secretion system F family protein [Sinomonas sp. ASV322]
MTIPLLASVLVAVPLAALCWSMLAVDRREARAVRRNLERGIATPSVPVPEVEAGSGAMATLETIARKLTPAAYVRRLDRLLALAGRPSSMPLGRLLAAKPALGAVGVGAGALFVSLGPSPTFRLIAVFLVVLGYMLPDLLLMSRGMERQATIQRDLPNTLDQLLISVEAGLGFEAALARASTTGRGPLAEELTRTLQDMQVGRSRRESYLGLAERTTVPEVRTFVQAVVQADAYGIAIARVLRVQAKAMRVRRRQRAEQQAMKLPVMVLFPLLFFIFPVLFIAILGPAVINTIATFSGR